MTASKRYTVHAIACFLLGLLIANEANAEEKARPAQPNVILILTDDLGWQDVICYDIDEPSPMETPNMDALARQGVLFRHHHGKARGAARREPVLQKLLERTVAEER